ncbi:hypothetical protein EIP91_007442 [Steccherinum ochraceum]|uniref:Peptidase A1 domain-containing protein n=1 Tax=Steccherinum ochraceum TaxID=92696 RepID=A0A4R0RQR8_9APHY|nr:hypothetical protein EIP91_007442 [Steccherinum ochraceum]
MHASILSLIFVSLCGITNALRLPIVARDAVPVAHRGIRTVMTQSVGDGEDLDIDNAKDVVYATNITLGGVEFPIQLDTGSSDVWVQTPFPINIAKDTSIPVNLTFGIGQAAGEVAFTDMEMGDYKVESQAFLNVHNATSFGAIFKNGIYGILGLSFDQGSSIFSEIFLGSKTNSTVGRTFLSNIFAQNASAPNMFSVQLGRTDDTDGPQEGIFTIGEYDENYLAIADQPKLPRTPAQLEQLTTLPRWSVQMDGMKVNGQYFQFNQSSVPEAAPGKTVSVLDTGFTFSQIPAAAVDFIYQAIPGAVFNASSGIYTVPCENTANLVFEFGGQEFPIDPLDITVVKTVDNQTVCQNTFRTMALPPVEVGPLGLDMILGVSFLKNAYVSFDFGDWTPQNTTGVPFIQMLPTTDAQQAAASFQAIRQKQVANNDASILNPPPSDDDTTGAGSIAELNYLQTSKPSTLQRRARIVSMGPIPLLPANGPVRIIVSTHRVPINLPFMPHAVNHCANSILESHGPVVLALLVGVAVLTLITAIASVFIAVRMWRRNRLTLKTEYEPIQIRDEEY